MAALDFPPLTHPIDLVACDMDGTLLNEEFDISPETEPVVRALLDKGIHFVLVSGRMKAGLMPFHARLGLQTPLISYNGALIWDAAKNAAIEHTPVSRDVARQVIEFAHNRDLHLQYFYDDEFYAVQRNDWMELYERRTRLTGNVVDSLNRFTPDQAPTKMILIEEPERARALIGELRAIHDGRLYVTNTMPEYVEMMDPSVNKGRALRRLGAALGVEPENMLVFGDAQNDETMFETAGLSIAMGNARDEVKAKTDLVTLANTENGVVRALEALGLTN